MSKPKLFEAIRVAQEDDGSWDHAPDDGIPIPLSLWLAYRSARKHLVEIEAAIYRECWS